MKSPSETETVSTLLAVVADLLRGDKHSRRTISDSTGKSLPTADRWIDQIEAKLPNTRRVRQGKTTWLVYDGRTVPSQSAAVGACVAASVGALFEGSSQGRNLKDARDFILRERDEAYGDLERKFVLAPRGGEYALPEAGPALDTIVEAILQNARLRIDYQHNNRETESLDIAPLTLVIFEHQFYVLARRERLFYPYRFARMVRVEKLEAAFEYPSKSEYDPRGILAQGFGIHTYGTGPIEEVEVIVSGPWATYALAHRWHPTQTAIQLDGGDVSVTLQVRVCRELETWVLGFGEHARVTRPQRLKEVIAARLKSASAAYGASQRPSLAKTRKVALQKAKRRVR